MMIYANEVSSHSRIINYNLDSGNFMFKFMIWMTVITTVGFIVLMIFDYK